MRQAEGEGAERGKWKRGSRHRTWRAALLDATMCGESCKESECVACRSWQVATFYSLYPSTPLLPGESKESKQQKGGDGVAGSRQQGGVATFTYQQHHQRRVRLDVSCTCATCHKPRVTSAQWWGRGVGRGGEGREKVSVECRPSCGC